MNLEWGSKLAERQDVVIDLLMNKGVFPSAEIFQKICSNAAVPLASVFCPCNLTVRHYCLKAVLQDTRQYDEKILRQCELLSRGGLWLEGYSYWMYTRAALCLYSDHFQNDAALKFIWRQDGYWSQSWYERRGRLFPVPFGDVWDAPLECQTRRERVATKPVEYLSDGIITVRSRAVRFNLHTEEKRATYYLNGCGFPVDYKTGRPYRFYEGYRKKYPTMFHELWALLLRLLSF